MYVKDILRTLLWSKYPVPTLSQYNNFSKMNQNKLINKVINKYWQYLVMLINMIKYNQIVDFYSISLKYIYLNHIKLGYTFKII